MISSVIPYRGSKTLAANWNTLVTIPITNILDASTFMLDITIQSGNGNNIIEICSFLRCFSTYTIIGGIPTRVLNKVQMVRSINTGGGSSIELIDGVDYQEVINGSNEIEIQIDKGAKPNTDASWSVILTCIET